MEAHGHCEKSPSWMWNFYQDVSSSGLNLQEDVRPVAAFIFHSSVNAGLILIFAHRVPGQQATSPFPQFTPFFLLSPCSVLLFLCRLSLVSSSMSPSLPFLPTHSPLSTFSSEWRCGKHRVLSFPQCSVGCQCRRWTPCRQLCLCWALWFTVRGHSPQTGNLWKLSFWQPSPQVSF